MVAPGCTKRLPLSGSTRPAAIFSSVDLPEPLRPIRQTRSLGGHRQFDAGQQRRAAEGQRDVFQLDQRRRHQFWLDLFARGAGRWRWMRRMV